jgi:hypothetical protein
LDHHLSKNVGGEASKHGTKGDRATVSALWHEEIPEDWHEDLEGESIMVKSWIFYPYWRMVAIHS